MAVSTATGDIHPAAVIVPGGHFDAYVKSFEVFGGRARDWFTRHLAA